MMRKGSQTAVAVRAAQKELELEAALELQSRMRPGYAWGGESSILASAHALALSQKGQMPSQPPRPSSAPAAARVSRPPHKFDAVTDRHINQFNTLTHSTAVAKATQKDAAGRGTTKAQEEAAWIHFETVQLKSMNSDSRGFISQLDRPENVSETLRCRTLPANFTMPPAFRLHKKDAGCPLKETQPLCHPRDPAPPDLRTQFEKPSHVSVEKLHTKFALEKPIHNTTLPRFAPLRFGVNIVRMERARALTKESRPGGGRGGSAAELAKAAGAGEFVVRRLRATTSEPVPRSLSEGALINKRAGS